MRPVLEFLAEEPLFLLFLLFALGTLLGTIRVAGISLGPAAVLFAAIAVTGYASTQDITLEISHEVGFLGLVLFTYSVGVLSGPNFFAALRRGLRPLVSGALILVGAAVVAVVVGRQFGLDGPTIAGTFAGGLTNTPALAAASEVAGDAVRPTVGYSIAYLFGVIGMLGAAIIALRGRVAAGDRSEDLVNLTVRVERPGIGRIRDIEASHGGRIGFSRVRHEETGPVLVAVDEELLREGDLVTVVGPDDLVRKVAAELGHASSHTLVGDRRYLDFRRITLSRPALSGRTVGELKLEETYAATVSRVRRGDTDLVATDDLVLQLGDRLRVIAPGGSMTDITKYLGDSLRGLSDINPLGLAIGMCLGVFIGSLHLPLPGGGLEISAAAGTLVVGLVFGRLGRVGPLVTTMPHAACATLSQFGMLAFLAYAGTKSGGQFVDAISSGEGWRIAVLGALITTFSAAAFLVVMRAVHAVEGTRLAGMLAGAQTQPAVLAYANDRTGFDNRVALGYALIYPMAMVLKILLAQILAGM